MRAIPHRVGRTSAETVAGSFAAALKTHPTIYGIITQKKANSRHVVVLVMCGEQPVNVTMWAHNMTGIRLSKAGHLIVTGGGFCAVGHIAEALQLELDRLQIDIELHSAVL